MSLINVFGHTTMGYVRRSGQIHRDDGWQCPRCTGPVEEIGYKFLQRGKRLSRMQYLSNKFPTMFTNDGKRGRDRVMVVTVRCAICGVDSDINLKEYVP